ncbi:hypothetical protein MSG28_004690 [Choristoneura fumiferana]|uniref:Uncharacterized protein n=1 Tax=Choristoneura fumiferana TaxID=7141 RepID=A0ACC0K788_CHOFU|nr:hypothetical protein MSG28_004690 [Choristoneura fumiferana]
MHEAYEVSHLLNLTVQIEAIAAYDGHLILGTRQGHLMMYSLSSNNGNQKYELQLLQYCKGFSKKPIQQIEVIPEDNLLLCLTDNILTTHDIKGVNFPLMKTFSQTKGASLFSIDNKSQMSMTGESNSVVRLCVAVRRKLQLYYGKNGEFKQHLFDFNIPDVPKVMAWVWDEPYLLGLMQDDNVVVQTVEPPLFVQTLPELNKARLMYR